VDGWRVIRVAAANYDIEPDFSIKRSWTIHLAQNW
jgi:hypothetical protein